MPRHRKRSTNRLRSTRRPRRSRRSRSTRRMYFGADTPPGYGSRPDPPPPPSKRYRDTSPYENFTDEQLIEHRRNLITHRDCLKNLFSDVYNIVAENIYLNTYDNEDIIKDIEKLKNEISELRSLGEGLRLENKCGSVPQIRESSQRRLF